MRHLLQKQALNHPRIVKKLAKLLDTIQVPCLCYLACTQHNISQQSISQHTIAHNSLRQHGTTQHGTTEGNTQQYNATQSTRHHTRQRSAESVPPPAPCYPRQWIIEMRITTFSLSGTAHGNTSSTPSDRQSAAQGLNMWPNVMENKLLLKLDDTFCTVSASSPSVATCRNGGNTGEKTPHHTIPKHIVHSQDGISACAAIAVFSHFCCVCLVGNLSDSMVPTLRLLYQVQARPPYTTIVGVHSHSIAPSMISDV